MNTDRIKEIQKATIYPESKNVQWALLQVWNECQQEFEAENKQLQQQIHQLSIDKTMLQEKHDFEKAGMQLEIDRLKNEVSIARNLVGLSNFDELKEIVLNQKLEIDKLKAEIDKTAIQDNLFRNANREDI